MDQQFNRSRILQHYYLSHLMQLTLQHKSALSPSDLLLWSILIFRVVRQGNQSFPFEEQGHRR
jgi:hypothetical protein